MESANYDEAGSDNGESSHKGNRCDMLEKKQWTSEETQQLLKLYKELGSKWVEISKHFYGRTEGEIKNKFYTTLKRVATQAQIEDPLRYGPDFEKIKKNLVQFVDIAIQYEHLLPSKKGRKKNIDKVNARKQGILFPKSCSVEKPIIREEPQQIFPQPILYLNSPPQPIAIPTIIPCAVPAWYPTGTFYAQPIPTFFPAMDYKVTQVPLYQYNGPGPELRNYRAY